MAQIEVKDQKQLTFGETFDFCVSGIKHRFFRSLLTFAVIVLAVAFFMFLQCSNIFSNSVKAGIESEIRADRRPGKLVNMVYMPVTRSDFVNLVLETHGRSADASRMAKVLGMTDDEFYRLYSMADREYNYDSFIDGIGVGKSRTVFGRLEGAELFLSLADRKAFAEVARRIDESSSIRIPGGIDDFNVFVVSYPHYYKKMSDAHAKWGDFRKKVIKEQGVVPEKQREFFVKASSDELVKWREVLTANGFELTDEEFFSIADYAQKNDLLARIQTRLSDADMRSNWRKAFGEKNAALSDKLAMLDDKKVVAMFMADDDKSFTEAELKTTAEDYRARTELRALEEKLNINVHSRESKLSSRQIYLMALSFLVCMMGITNAMLMSITERFREIATLKCLGATDSFILIQVELEAVFQGALGGMAGVVLGFAVALLGSLVQVGTRVFTTFSWGGIIGSSLISLASGILLAVLASLYPSIKASRMAPMEAMRVE